MLSVCDKLSGGGENKCEGGHTGKPVRLYGKPGRLFGKPERLLRETL